MATKETIEINVDNGVKDKHIIIGQSGVYNQSDYYYNDTNLYNSDNESNRFVLLDLWQIGIFGSENCKQIYDKKKDKYIVTEKDINNYVNEVIEYINDSLFNAIKEEIVSNIEDNEEHQYLPKQKE